MQNLYNLAYREEEREVLPFGQRDGIAVTPWSPLASGLLARPFEQLEATERGERLSEFERGRLNRYLNTGGEEINQRVQEIAADKDVSMAQIALA